MTVGVLGGLLPVSAWAAPARSTVPSPNTTTQQGLLDGVSCTSARACTAIGDYATSFYSYETLAEVWAGKKWAIEKTPNPADAGEGSFLSAVSCTSDTWCTAVGAYAVVNNGVPRTLAEAWNGKKWTIEPTLTRAEWSLSAVSCTSATKCTAVGSGSGRTLAEDWNGKKWTVETTPNSTKAKDDDLSCTSAKACIAVGSGAAGTLAEVWNGKKWAIEHTANPTGAKDSSLSGVSCTSATTCTAVGYYENSANTSLTLAEAWSDTRWTVEHTPKP